MKDISAIYSDGHIITLVDSEGNSIVSPLNLDPCFKDVYYKDGSLVFTDIEGQEKRIDADSMVNHSLARITPVGFEPYDYSTNAILAQIIAKVLGEFLQTPDGVETIKKELNNYFNGTS